MNKIVEVDMFENIKTVLERSLERARLSLQSDKKLFITLDISKETKKAIIESDVLDINELTKMIDFVSQKIGE